jgi:hypothetical protein
MAAPLMDASDRPLRLLQLAFLQCAGPNYIFLAFTISYGSLSASLGRPELHPAILWGIGVGRIQGFVLSLADHTEALRTDAVPVHQILLHRRCASIG